MSKKNQTTRTDYLTSDQYAKLVGCLSADKNVLGETYARVAKATALRIADVLALTWGKLLSKQFTVTEKKTGKKRTITVSQKTHDAFVELYRKNGEPGDTAVFMNRRTERPYTTQYINREMKEWKRKYGIAVGNFSSHSFRKSFGREYWDKQGRTDEALLKLSIIFNHSSIAVTRIYLGIRDEEIADAYEMIDA